MNDNAGRKKKSINLQSAVLTGIQLLGFAAAGAVIVIDLMPTYEKGRGFVFLLCVGNCSRGGTYALRLDFRI